MRYILNVWLVITFQISVRESYASQCDTSWTDHSSTFAVPSDLNPLFIPFKLSNYLFLVGTSSSNPNTVSIYYHNLNNYTSLLSSLYDTQSDSKQFQSELNGVVSSPNSLQWHLASEQQHMTSPSLYPFIAYPSTWFVDESTNDLYIVSPIASISTADYESTSSLWRLHLDIDTEDILLSPSSTPSPVNISYFWQNVSSLMVPVNSCCVVFDDESQTAFIFGGIDAEGSTLDIVQSYNIADQQWTQLSSMSSPRRLSACLMDSGNGNIYVFGGNKIDHYGTIEMYDITLDQWSPLDDDENSFPFPRYATSAVQLKASDTIYIVGGLIQSDAATSRIGMFDPNTESLEICSNPNHSLPYNRGAASSVVISDTIWVFGGYSGHSGNIGFDDTISIGWSHEEYTKTASTGNDANQSIIPSLHSVTAQMMEYDAYDVDSDDTLSTSTSQKVHVFGSLSVDSVLVGVLAVIAVLMMVICAYYIMLHVVMRKVKAQEDSANPNGNGKNRRDGGLQSADSSNSTLLEIGDKAQAMRIQQMAVEMQHMMEMKKRIKKGHKANSPALCHDTLHLDAHHSSLSSDRSDFVGTRSRTPTFAEHYTVNNNVYRDYQPIPMNSYIESTVDRSAMNPELSSRYQIPSITAQSVPSSIAFQPQPAPFHVAPMTSISAVTRSNTPFEALQKQQVIRWLHDKVGLPEYAPNFMDHGYDRMMFIKGIKMEDLLTMNITKSGHQKRILQQIEVLIASEKEHQELLEKQHEQKSNPLCPARDHLPLTSKKSRSIAETLNISKLFFQSRSCTKDGRDDTCKGTKRKRSRGGHTAMKLTSNDVTQAESVWQATDCAYFDSSECYTTEDDVDDGDDADDSKRHDMILDLGIEDSLKQNPKMTIEDVVTLRLSTVDSERKTGTAGDTTSGPSSTRATHGSCSEIDIHFAKTKLKLFDPPSTSKGTSMNATGGTATRTQIGTNTITLSPPSECTRRHRAQHAPKTILTLSPGIVPSLHGHHQRRRNGNFESGSLIFTHGDSEETLSPSFKRPSLRIEDTNTSQSTAAVMMSTKGRKGTDMILPEDEMSSEEQHALPMQKRTTCHTQRTSTMTMKRRINNINESHCRHQCVRDGDETRNDHDLYLNDDLKQNRNRMKKSAASPSSSVSAIWDPVMEEENGNNDNNDGDDDDLDDEEEEDEDVDDIDLDLQSTTRSENEGRDALTRQSMTNKVRIPRFSSIPTDPSEPSDRFVKGLSR